MAVIKFDVKNGSKDSVQHDLNRTLLSTLLPQWKEELEIKAQELMKAEPQIGDNDIPQSSSQAVCTYEIKPDGQASITLAIYRDEIDTSKEVEIGTYKRGNEEVSGYTRTLSSKRNFKLPDGSWITSSRVPDELAGPIIEEAFQQVLGGGVS